MKRLAVAIVVVVAAACHRREEPPSIGDANRGRALMARYGCSSCHIIPGVAYRGLVGPPLDHIARRAYIAGRLPNEPQTMIQWIRFPQSVDPATAMPNVGADERDARDMTAYLFTLK